VIQIKITGKGYEQIQKELSNIELKSKADLIKLGDTTVSTMQGHIKSSIKREGSTGKLENSIRSHIFSLGKRMVVGIGKVVELPIYWAAINFGSSHLLGKMIPGYFGDMERPQAGASGQKFTYKKKTHLMVPKKSIPAMNYIERTWATMATIIPKLFGR